MSQCPHVKPKIGRIGRVYEQEANRISKQVMHASDVQRAQTCDGPSDKCIEGGILTKDKIRNLGEATRIAAEGGVLISDPLSKATLEAVGTLIASNSGTSRQNAIDLIVADEASFIKKGLLVGGIMKYVPQPSDPELAKESPYGYTVSREGPLSEVEIYAAAFESVALLYSTMLHEYQHVVQNAGNRTLSVVPEGSANNQQEAEAYLVEIIKSDSTGISKQPKLIREKWRMLHDDDPGGGGWGSMPNYRKKPLASLYERAFRKIAAILMPNVGSKAKIRYEPFIQKTAASRKRLVGSLEARSDSKVGEVAEKSSRVCDIAYPYDPWFGKAIHPAKSRSGMSEVDLPRGGKPRIVDARAFIGRQCARDFGGVERRAQNDTTGLGAPISAQAADPGGRTFFDRKRDGSLCAQWCRIAADQSAHAVRQRGALQRKEDILQGLPPTELEKRTQAIVEGAVSAGFEAELATIPAGETTLPPKVERIIKWHLRHSRRQAALDVLVDHLVDDGAIRRKYLFSGKMHYRDQPGREGAAELKGHNADGSAIIAVTIGIDAFDPPIGGDPTRHAGHNIVSLYTTVLHEYKHVVQNQGADGDLAKIVDPTSRWTKETIRQIEAYAEEIAAASQSGLDKKPDMAEDIWMRLHKDNWMALNNATALKNAKVTAVLTKGERARLNVLYETTYKRAKDIVMKPLPHLPFASP